MNAFLSTFTPSLMPHDTLEAILVQRHELVGRIVDLVRESAMGGSKHHALLIGPRGIGKTHIVSLVYHRVRAMDELQDRLLIAWLREEEWGVSTLRDLLIRILLRLAEEYSDPELKRRVDELYRHDPDAAERLAGGLLREYVAGRTLLVLAENLGEMFAGLGEQGQQRLRAYIQGNPFFTILATAQSLFGGVRHQTSPFYGFFRIYHLEELTLEEARELLGKVAKLDEDEELASFIATPTGRARIRAVHHLGGGNHRVYVIFSQFLTRETLDELVDAVMQMIEKLTPYYQSRMSRLSPQQRKIVEHLCDRRGAAPVKEIAERCFATSQAVSSTLKDLRGMGYVRSTPHGRESYYELREPLMRICIEVKKQRGQPVRLFVDFLRIWYTPKELEKRLDTLSPSSMLDREYLGAALRASRGEEEDPRLAACIADYGKFLNDGDYERALDVAGEMMAVRKDARSRMAQGLALLGLDRHDEALTSFEKGLELNPEDAWTWHGRGVALIKLGRVCEALASFDKALEMDPKHGLAWYDHGAALYALRRYEEALASLAKAIELSEDNPKPFFLKAVCLVCSGRWNEGLSALRLALGAFPDEDDVAALADESILVHLAPSDLQAPEAAQRLEALIALHDETGSTEALGIGLLAATAQLLHSDSMTQEAISAWLEAWKAVAADREEFGIALRLLEAAVRYKAERDERILLELPAEERTIVRQMLGIEETEEREGS